MPIKSPSLKHKIAQKLMLDLRFYSSATTQKLEPVTELPNEIASLISDTGLGGVILFSENLDNAQQIIKLTHDLQKAAQQSEFSSPMLISVDQEGGRVTRLPVSASTPFTGNMSIGATYKKFGVHYAIATGQAIANDLTLLGINVNNAPCIDINNNPDNPVINIRSFSEDPVTVAKLGAAQVKAMQKEGILCAIKHFPGHGNTQVDSHTGLPRVDSSREDIISNELHPFTYTIEHAEPAMLMTAHIQYPALDSSKVMTKTGNAITPPATMSYEIMHNLLREQMQFKGVSITDALDMAGISDYFDMTQAVINTFKADVDIALMPIKIRIPADLKKLPALITAVEQAVNAHELNREQLNISYERIQKLKQQYDLEQTVNVSLNQKTFRFNSRQNSDHKRLEQALAYNSVTLYKGKIDKALIGLLTQKVHIVMPDTAKATILTKAIQNEVPFQISVQVSSLLDVKTSILTKRTKACELLIIGHIAPKQSAVEFGGIDDLERVKALDKLNANTFKRLLDTLHKAKACNKKVIFISLRAPYEIKEVMDLADVILATYAYNIKSEGGNIHALPYEALAKVITGEHQAIGDLPVSI
ncbi:glycoside hydrolase family 3 protein [Algibacillus agarilyticus]|uniref:glycoside hydrolase family 3 N-terminal domain-containing protein n=1 Tax=Algibacillus agarilyticus TaxID=2234133 RepID=UPI000DD07D84|nr:glycoside hydrolase family 3 protein [Algibacillus agarilyticus]